MIESVASLVYMFDFCFFFMGSASTEVYKCVNVNIKELAMELNSLYTRCVLEFDTIFIVQLRYGDDVVRCR